MLFSIFFSLKSKKSSEKFGQLEKKAYLCTR